jgi:hypothetical protein
LYDDEITFQAPLYSSTVIFLGQMLDRLVLHLVRKETVALERATRLEERERLRQERAAARQAARSVPDDQPTPEDSEEAIEMPQAAAVHVPMTPERRAALRAEREAKAVQRHAGRALRDAARVERRTELDTLASSWEDSLPEGITRVIIDGENIAGGGPHRLPRASIVSLVDAFLCRSSGLQHVDCALVCGRRGHPAWADSATQPNLRLVRSDDATSADTLVDLVRSADSVLAVTSDRELALRLLAAGARVMRSGVFARVVDPAGVYARGQEYRAHAAAAASGGLSSGDMTA